MWIYFVKCKINKASGRHLFWQLSYLSWVLVSESFIKLLVLCVIMLLTVRRVKTRPSVTKNSLKQKFLDWWRWNKPPLLLLEMNCKITNQDFQWLELQKVTSKTHKRELMHFWGTASELFNVTGSSLGSEERCRKWTKGDDFL
jgi:hypothetical protein